METSFETNRLLLEKLSSTDDDFILELVNTKGWLDFIGDRNVRSKEEASFYIRKILDNQNINYWVAKLKDDKTPIGVVTFIKRDYLNYPDIGFAFLPAFSEMGYAYEATKSVLDGIMRRVEHACIFATTIPRNLSSIKLLKKLGFQFEKEVTVQSETLHVYSASNSLFI